MDTIAALRKSDLFHFLDESILKKILKESSIIDKIEAGQNLFLEGDTAHAFYLVLEGRVKISRISPFGKEVILKNVLPGDSFAELVIFEKKEYPATATAQDDSVVLKILTKPFLSLLFKDQQITKAFIINLLKKIRFLAKNVELLNNAQIPERFFHFIQSYYGKFEVVEFKESKKEIASVIGTIPETFSRMIKKLRDQGVIISWEKSTLTLEKNFWINLESNTKK